MYAEVKGSTVVIWPYDYDTLCKKNPYTTFPSDTPILELYKGTDANLDGNSLVFVKQEPQPNVNPRTQIAVVNSLPNLNGSDLVMGWTVQTMTPEQQNSATAAKAKAVRDERDKKLSDSDWTQLPDTPVDKTAWASYRQELRDISKQTGFPWEVTWPTAP